SVTTPTGNSPPQAVAARSSSPAPRNEIFAFMHAPRSCARAPVERRNPALIKERIFRGSRTRDKRYLCMQWMILRNGSQHGTLELYPRSQLHDAIGRYVEEIGDVAGVARHRREDLVAPQCDAFGVQTRNDLLARKEIRDVHRFELQ